MFVAVLVVIRSIGHFFVVQATKFQKSSDNSMRRVCFSTRVLSTAVSCRARSVWTLWSYLQSVWFYYFRFHTPSALSHCNDQIDFRFVFDTRHERKPVKHFQQHIWRQQKRQESNGSIKQKTKHHSKIKHKRCPELYDDVLRISTVQ